MQRTGGAGVGLHCFGKAPCERGQQAIAFRDEGFRRADDGSASLAGICQQGGRDAGTGQRTFSTAGSAQHHEEGAAAGCLVKPGAGALHGIFPAKENGGAFGLIGSKAGKGRLIRGPGDSGAVGVEAANHFVRSARAEARLVGGEVVNELVVAREGVRGDIAGAQRGDHLFQHSAQGEEVRGEVEFCATVHALRRSVGFGADKLADTRQAIRFPLHVAGDAEIQQPYPAIIAEHDIRRLEVAVDDALAVNVAQRVEHGEQYLHDPRRPGRVAGQFLRKVPAVQPGHGVPEKSLRRAAAVINCGQSRVIQFGQNGDLIFESLLEVRVTIARRVHELERLVTLEIGAIDFENRAHAAAAGEGFHAVRLAFQHRLHFLQRGHPLAAPLAAHDGGGGARRHGMF